MLSTAKETKNVVHLLGYQCAYDIVCVHTQKIMFIGIEISSFSTWPGCHKCQTQDDLVVLLCRILLPAFYGRSMCNLYCNKTKVFPFWFVLIQRWIIFFFCSFFCCCFCCWSHFFLLSILFTNVLCLLISQTVFGVFFFFKYDFKTQQ